MIYFLNPKAVIDLTKRCVVLSRFDDNCHTIKIWDNREICNQKVKEQK